MHRHVSKNAKHFSELYTLNCNVGEVLYSLPVFSRYFCVSFFNRKMCKNEKKADETIECFLSPTVI